MNEPKIIRHTFDSGVEAIIHPVSPFTFRAIRVKAAERFPYPDPEPYRKPVEHGVPGLMSRPEDDEDYKRLCAEADNQRGTYFTEALLDLALEFPVGRDALIERFAAQRKSLAEWVTLPEDDWEATLKHCILIGTNEPQLIADIAMQAAPLTQEEVAEGATSFFRLDLQRYSTRGFGG